ncbi:Sodium hydrogen exchanger [Lecanosticta acicola]|uniref:Sodium hydrogen exchanger n=1 Tax=Lecanosticta acicola TaxID=111012 RepID=A0AAI9E990_9PEZI|nr:Sodium hydrogen exchanger [Lecanosticta acicola]
MVWSQIEATPPHVSYLLLATFLISYVLFTNFLRNRLHLSEPPIALLVGIILGPEVLGWITPNFCGQDGCSSALRLASPDKLTGWGWGDDIIQEVTRVIVGIQVFVVSVGLPRHYANRHWRSVLMMLGPIMTVGWLLCTAFCKLLFATDWPTSMVVAACLTPTDPVLAASILANSQFSNRVPKRLKDMLSAESGCNDGISFPFLYIGLFILTQPTTGLVLKDWFLITILWQCVFGVAIGLLIGEFFNRVLRFSDNRGYIDRSGFIAFYLLLALFSVGVGSTLGSDDFLVAFGAGYGFARDGWFAEKTRAAHLPHIVDLLLSSAMFVYLGTILPWYAFSPQHITPFITPGRLLGFLALVILFRRIPIMMAMYRWIPDIKTWREALFCGHFGPMGLGALFLAIEARAVLENGTSTPEPHPPKFGRPYTPREQAIEAVWPIVSFIVFGSTLIHGFSVLALSIWTHFMRDKEDRASLLAAETDPLAGMEHGGGDGSSIISEEAEDQQDLT